MSDLKYITLKYPYSKTNQWGKYLLYLLSTDKKITQIIDPKLINIPVFKSNHLIPFKMNEQSFFIDDWDYHYPTSSLANANIPHCYLQENKPTILKIQYTINNQSLYDKIYEKFQIKVLPFIIFPNKVFNLSFNKWQYTDNHEYLCFHTGRIWRERHKWVNYLNNSSFKKPDTSKQLNEKDFESLLLKTKWGLILKGKGVGKNRREVEYMSIGMPLVLNYKPEYPFPYNPDEHYVYLEKPSDIDKLIDLDPKPFAEKSVEIYNKYYSVESGGLYNSFNSAYLKTIN